MPKPARSRRELLAELQPERGERRVARVDEALLERAAAHARRRSSGSSDPACGGGNDRDARERASSASRCRCRARPSVVTDLERRAGWIALPVRARQQRLVRVGVEQVPVGLHDLGLWPASGVRVEARVRVHRDDRPGLRVGHHDGAFWSRAPPWPRLRVDPQAEHDVAGRLLPEQEVADVLQLEARRPAGEHVAVLPLDAGAADDDRLVPDDLGRRARRTGTRAGTCRTRPSRGTERARTLPSALMILPRGRVNSLSRSRGLRARRRASSASTTWRYVSCPTSRAAARSRRTRRAGSRGSRAGRLDRACAGLRRLSARRPRRRVLLPAPTRRRCGAAAPGSRSSR